MPENPENLDSVAQELLELLFDVAPHRADELRELLKKHNVRVIAVEDQHESPFVVTPGDEGMIRAHSPALKRQLVMAFAYVIAYRELVRDLAVDGRELNVPDTPKANQAKEMLRWAMFERYQVARAKEHGGAAPNESVPSEWFPAGWIDGSDDRIALGMFYTAMAADLHHELAHLTKRHGIDDNANPIVQEMEADQAAANWLVGHLSEGDRLFNGSMLGLALSQTYEVFLTLEGFKNDPYHPPLVGRLRDAIAPRLSNDDHPVWAFVATVLMLHLSLANIPPAIDRTRRFLSFREMADYLFSVFEKKDR